MVGGIAVTTKERVETLLVQATDRLRRAGSDAPRLEAELLLAHLLDRSRAWLLAHPEARLSPAQQVRYEEMVARRAASEPLPYITGHAPFYGLDFLVSPAVLIPRPETERLVDLALDLTRSLCEANSPPSLTIADVGTGSGCLAVVLARRLPQARLYALDLSPEALALARRNALRHGVADRIRFLTSDLLQALPEPVDLIVANPPYVAEDEWDRLPRSVREHEPRLALAGGPDGLAVIRRLLAQAPAHLRPGGWLLMEMGAGQGEAVLTLAQAAFPTAQIALHPDLAGHQRILAVHRASHAPQHASRSTQELFTLPQVRRVSDAKPCFK